jgi:type IV pilus assembly protein PilN
MARINLVPWRETRRLQRKKEFMVMLGVGVTATLLVMGLWHLFNQNMIDNQIERNGQLRKEILVVDAKLKEIQRLDELRDKLLARMELIQSLQSSRPESVHMMDEIVFIMPDGVVLDTIKQSGQVINLDGVAQSNAQISALMRSIEDSDWLGKPLLKLISSKEKESGQNGFSLSVKQVKPKAEEL